MIILKIILGVIIMMSGLIIIGLFLLNLLPDDRDNIEL